MRMGFSPEKGFGTQRGAYPLRDDLLGGFNDRGAHREEQQGHAGGYEQTGYGAGDIFSSFV
jgi:hypothetical protein